MNSMTYLFSWNDNSDFTFDKYSIDQNIINFSITCC